VANAATWNFSGAFYVDNGTFRTGVANIFNSANRPIVIAATGVFDTNNVTDVIGFLSGAAGSKVIGFNTNTWSICGGNTTNTSIQTTSTFAGVFQCTTATPGAWKIQFRNTAQLTLTGDSSVDVGSTFKLKSGTIGIDSNTGVQLALGSDGALGTSNTLSINQNRFKLRNVKGSLLTLNHNWTGPGTNTVFFDGNDNIKITGTVNLNGAGPATFVIDNPQTEFNGIISNGSIKKQGNGTIYMTAQHSFATGFTLSRGTLKIGASSVGGVGTNGPIGTGNLILGAEASPTGGPTFIQGDGVARTISNTWAFSNTADIVGALDWTINGSSDLTFGATGGALDLGGRNVYCFVTNTGTTTFAGNLNNTASNFRKDGTGLLVLTGTANTMTGGLFVSNGEIQLKDNCAFTGVTPNFNIQGQNSTLRILNTTGTNTNRIPDAATLNFYGGTLAVDSTSAGIDTDETLAAIVFNGACTIKLTGTATRKAILRIANENFAVASGAPFTVNGAMLSLERLGTLANTNLFATLGTAAVSCPRCGVNGQLAEYTVAEGLRAMATTAPYISQANGDWDIDAATVWAATAGTANAGVAPNSTTNTNVIIRNTVTLNNARSVSSLSMDTGSPSLTGTGTLTVSAARPAPVNFSGSGSPTIGVTLAFGANEGLINNDCTGTVTFNNSTSVFTGTTNAITVGGSGSSVTNISGVVGSGLTSGLILCGGTVTLSNTNAYTGGTTVNGGTLKISADANLGNTSGSITVAQANTRQGLGGGILQVTNTMTLAHTLNIGTRGGAVTVDAGKTLTVANALTAAGTDNCCFGLPTNSSSGRIIFQTAATRGAADTFLYGGMSLRDSVPGNGANYISSANVLYVYNGTLEVDDGVTLSTSAPQLNFAGSSGCSLTGIGSCQTNTNNLILVDKGSVLNVNWIDSTNATTPRTPVATDTFHISSQFSDNGTADQASIINVNVGAGRINFPQASSQFDGYWNISGSGGLCIASSDQSFGDGSPLAPVTVNSGATLVINTGTQAWPIVLNGGTLAAAGADRQLQVNPNNSTASGSFDSLYVSTSSTISTEDHCSRASAAPSSSLTAIPARWLALET